MKNKSQGYTPVRITSRYFYLQPKTIKKSVDDIPLPELDSQLQQGFHDLLCLYSGMWENRRDKRDDASNWLYFER